MKRLWFVTLLLLVGLLAGCGGGGETAPETAPASATAPSSAASPSPTAAPVPEGPQATVVDVINDVDAHALPDEEWTPALPEMTVYQGGEVWAKEASTARVEVEKALVRVAPNTIFTLGQPAPETVQLSMDEGQMWVNVEGLAPGETFEVETPSAVASVRGTRFSVRVDPDGVTWISVVEGTVWVRAGGEEVEVSAGMEVRVPPGGPPDAPMLMDPEQSIPWGSAVGDQLDLVLPVYGTPQVITNTGFIGYPRCSADGRYTAYSYFDPEKEKPGYFLYDWEEQAYRPMELPESVWRVDFHPTENRIAYNNANGEICVADLDGAAPSCFSTSISYGNVTYTGITGQPVWSPDGERLLFTNSVGENFNSHIFIARPDGSEVTQLTSGPGDFVEPVWAPDGSRIAFLHTEESGGPAELWVVDRGGDLVQAVTDVAFNSYASPAWAPDGSALAVPGYMEEDHEEGTGGLWVVPLADVPPWMVPGTEGMRCWDPVWYPGASPLAGRATITSTDEAIWPLFFEGYPPDSETHGIWWYAPDVTTSAALLVESVGGPVWCPEGEYVLFSHAEYGEGDHGTRISTLYRFPLLSVGDE